jgi:hypothetical protein
MKPTLGEILFGIWLVSFAVFMVVGMVISV